MSKVCCIIPARAGSTRLKNKNKMILVDRPMIYYSIETALFCSYIDEVVITTDDEEILEMVQRDFISPKIRLINRPEYLATSDTPQWAVVEHALQGYSGNTIVILMQPTSPTRRKENVDKAWMLFNYCEYKFGVVSGYWDYPMHEYGINGAIYIYFLNTIINTHSFIQDGIIMYRMSYDDSCDVDDLEDFREAERILLRRLDQRRETNT